MRPSHAGRIARLVHFLRLSWANMDVTKLNLFLLCKCLRHAGKVMVLIVMGLVGLIWYTVVATAFVPGLQSGPGGLRVLWGLGLVLYTAVICMILWSYLATFLTCPGYVPSGWTPFQDEEAAMQELDQAEMQLVSQQQLQQQPLAAQQHQSVGDPGCAYLERPRFCKKCQAWKPPRAHHCSMTGRCVLRMDHYCVWVLNCVGLLNYKYFVLFLFYTFLGCLASGALLIKPCMQFFNFADPPIGRTILAFVCFVFSAAFSLALLGFLIMHLRLIDTNHTTIEAYEKRPIRPWPYDRGRALNWAEVFGREGWRRLAPVRVPEEERALLSMYLDGGSVLQPSWGGVGAAAREQLSTTSNDSEHTL